MIDNPNPRNFYTKKEMVDRQNYIPTIKKQILSHIDDLKMKIENEEPFPHGNIDIDKLCEFDDRIQELLNNWYY